MPVVFDFSHQGHALVTLYVQFLCFDWSRFDRWVDAENLCSITKETFFWLVNLICDFIGQSAKSDSKNGKEREGERQLWRRRLTFSLIHIDSLFVQKETCLNGNCFVSRKHRLVLTFCGRCLVSRREIVASDRRINPTAVSQNLPCSAQRNPRDVEENFAFQETSVIITRVFSTGMNYF